jgi:hypothetical protein
MSARNITTEKMDTSGFQTGGKSYGGPEAGKHTPKKAIMNESRTKGDTAMVKTTGKSVESKTNKYWKG